MDTQTLVNHLIFHEQGDEMIAVTAIGLFNLCEPHFLPFSEPRLYPPWPVNWPVKHSPMGGERGGHDH